MHSNNTAARRGVQQRRAIPIDQQQIEAIMTAEDDAASDALQAIYAFISSDAYRHGACARRCASCIHQHMCVCMRR
jgi:hypothetical protein